jgi:hypothetical protein
MLTCRHTQILSQFLKIIEVDFLRKPILLLKPSGFIMKVSRYAILSPEFAEPISLYLSTRPYSERLVV